MTAVIGVVSMLCHYHISDNTPLFRYIQRFLYQPAPSHQAGCGRVGQASDSTQQPHALHSLCRSEVAKHPFAHFWELQSHQRCQMTMQGFPFVVFCVWFLFVLLLFLNRQPPINICILWGEMADGGHWGEYQYPLPLIFSYFPILHPHFSSIPIMATNRHSTD